ncbi:hypothetical protein AAVH_13861 [Aphelenchoides avenae]|nr:hypothetical protein AAVH_13861 [Aphelenchus avenae]
MRRDSYDEGRPCKVSSVILDTGCTLTIDVKSLLQPFISSKLGVASCEVTVGAEEWNDGMFDALWSACDGRMAQSLKFYTEPRGRRSFIRLINLMLAGPDHGDRHYSLVGIEAKLQGIAENYIEVC